MGNNLTEWRSRLISEFFRLQTSWIFLPKYFQPCFSMLTQYDTVSQIEASIRKNVYYTWREITDFTAYFIKTSFDSDHVVCEKWGHVMWFFVPPVTDILFFVLGFFLFCFQYNFSAYSLCLTKCHHGQPGLQSHIHGISCADKPVWVWLPNVWLEGELFDARICFVSPVGEIAICHCIAIYSLQFQF